jgi:hypothetical protein
MLVGLIVYLRPEHAGVEFGRLAGKFKGVQRDVLL